MITREEVNDLVSIFYQPTFKTFYINSVDGVHFVKPLGIFVSLGITTSLKSIESIKNILGEKYNAVLANISSKNIGNQHMNTLIDISNPTQYTLEEFDSNIFTREQALEELSNLKYQMKPGEDLRVLQDYAPMITRLQDLIEKLDKDNGWEDHLIQREPEAMFSYRIFHKKVNYMKSGDVEYRLGIYVSEKE